MDEAALRALLDDVTAGRTSADDAVAALRRLPFADVARESPAVVCGIHRGLVQGVLEETESPLALRDLQVFPRPGVCVLRLGDEGMAGAPD